MQNPATVPFTKADELLGNPNSDENVEDCIRLPDDQLIYKHDAEQYVSSHLDVSRLNVIHNQLWRAGRPGKVFPLHHQKVLQRQILVTERVDLHLIWHNDLIFIKPLPSFLINRQSFADHISPNLAPSALGFLHTYTKIISHRTDFSIAQSLGLLPLDITWRAWSRFRIDLTTNITHSHQINKRYHYGELRLSRLNNIYRLHQRSWRSGYFLIHTRYQSLFRANFEWLLLAFAYTSVALSALQVLLAADQGGGEKNNGLLRGVSFGVGTASIVCVVAAVLVMAALFGILHSINKTFAKSKMIDGESGFPLNGSRMESIKV